MEGLAGSSAANGTGRRRSPSVSVCAGEFFGWWWWCGSGLNGEVMEARESGEWCFPAAAAAAGEEEEEGDLSSGMVGRRARFIEIGWVCMTGEVVSGWWVWDMEAVGDVDGDE